MASNAYNNHIYGGSGSNSNNRRPPAGALKLLKRKIKKKQVSTTSTQKTVTSSDLQPNKNFNDNNYTEYNSNSNYNVGSNYMPKDIFQKPKVSELDQLHAAGDAKFGRPKRGYVPPARQQTYAPKFQPPQQQQHHQQLYNQQQQQQPYNKRQQLEPYNQPQQQYRRQIPASSFNATSNTNSTSYNNNNNNDNYINNKGNNGNNPTANKAPPNNIVFKTKRVVNWACNHCNRECIPVRGESRCLCGHRYKEHTKGKRFGCAHDRCKCKSFFFVVSF